MTRATRVALTLLVVLLPASSTAQSAGLGAVVVASEHPRLSDMTGLSGRFRWSIADSWSLRARAERASGDWRGFGNTCSGLSLPEACQSEAINNHNAISNVAAGLAFALFRWHGLMPELAANVGLAWVKSTTSGVTSGRSLSASKTLWLREIGAELAWSPSARLPLTLEAAAGFGMYAPLEESGIVDGYTPFESDFSAMRLRLGLAWRFSAP